LAALSIAKTAAQKKVISLGGKEWDWDKEFGNNCNEVLDYVVAGKIRGCKLDSPRGCTLDVTTGRVAFGTFKFKNVYIEYDENNQIKTILYFWKTGKKFGEECTLGKIMGS
ncbi:MAG: hypothetical protein LBD32_02760, partial [Cytophagales bacterium]|jgi:hypothetical protein|nr:hypothetical protein [Cytophagales bacterium]